MEKFRVKISAQYNRGSIVFLSVWVKTLYVINGHNSRHDCSLFAKEKKIIATLEFVFCWQLANLYQVIGQ